MGGLRGTGFPARAQDVHTYMVRAEAALTESSVYLSDKAFCCSIPIHSGKSTILTLLWRACI